MSLDRFVSRSTRQSQSTQASSSSTSITYHSTASRRLGKARAVSPALSIESSTSRSVTPGSTPSNTSRLTYNQDFPSQDGENDGIAFEIDWQNIYLNGRRLNPLKVGYRVRHKSQLRGKREVSGVYRYGADLLWINEANESKKLWLCKACHERRAPDAAKVVNGNTHITNHLIKVHRIDPSSGALPDIYTPSDPFEAARIAGTNRFLSHTPWQEQSLQAAVVDWVIMQDQSFRHASSPATRGLLSWNRIDLLAALPSSHTTLSSYVHSSLEDRKNEIRQLFMLSQSRINVSLDVWTSPNYISFLALVAHFTDADLYQRDLLIGFRNLFGDHTGENQAIVTSEILKEYDIIDKFHCFVGDNATNNDSQYYGNLNKLLGLELSESHRIRCAGHIINLVVKAYIYGQGVSKWEEELAKAAPKDQFIMYRKRGVVGKLHNFVNAILSSHKRRELFITIQKGLAEEDPIWSFGTLNLIQDGGVRWHSVYFMLLRCLELREPIKKFIRSWRKTIGVADGGDDDYNPLLDELSDEEWEDVEQLVDQLEKFFEMTKRLEGSSSVSGYGSLWQTIPNLHFLDLELRDTKKATENDPEDSYIKNAVRFGQEKLTTYWGILILEPPISYYAVATWLHPSLRLHYFKDKWRSYPDWYKKVENSVRRVFEQYKTMDRLHEEMVPESPSRRKQPAAHTDRYLASLQVDPAYLSGSKLSFKKARQQNEIDAYNGGIFKDYATDPSLNNTMDINPLEWWKTSGKREFPTLFKMAMDILSIPATSCECERAFSKGRRIVTDDRNMLSGKSIEALQLQKNWLQNGVVKSELNDLIEHVERSSN